MSKPVIKATFNTNSMFLFPLINKAQARFEVTITTLNSFIDFLSSGLRFFSELSVRVTSLVSAGVHRGARV